MPHDIQINPSDGSLWIADSRNNRVRAISGAANAPGANVPTGGVDAPTTTSTTIPPIPPTTTTTRTTPTTPTTTPPVTGPTATPPGAPTMLTASGLVSTNRGVGIAALSWSAPSDGGSPIRSYQITAMPGGHVTTVGGPATSGILSGLENGTSYTFTIRAENAVGLGAPSTSIGPVVPYSYPAPVPGVSAARRDRSADIRWETPDDDGGRPITGYQVSAEPLGPRAAGERSAAAGAVTVTVDAGQRTATLAGLDPRTQYTFGVVATNEAGASPVIPASTTTGTTVPGRSGYWMVGSDGVVYPFGDAKHHGNAATTSAVDLEPTPSGNGYWIVDERGRGLRLRGCGRAWERGELEARRGGEGHEPVGHR